MDSKAMWHKKAEKDNWKSKFKAVVVSVKYHNEYNYVEFFGKVLEHNSEYIRKKKLLIHLFKGFIDKKPNEGDVIECIGRGRIGYNSEIYEISFIEPKLIERRPILVEVIEILNKPTGAVECSNGEVRYYIRHGEYNATYSHSTSYEGIMKSLKKVGRNRLFEKCDTFTLKELHVKNKLYSPVILARKYWKYCSMESIESNINYRESDGEAKYKITKIF